ncbi:MAG: lytic transglycosylase domain-containing protein [Pyrinomonadaceae bacterium]|nr:lytic transglycosylase domain-containing protein [Pyrinomonadaceae bacterium]
MKRAHLAIIALLVLSTAAFGQTSGRTFDNFDRSQGVQVYYPPAPPTEPAVPKTRRVKKNGKWVVVVEKPANKVQRTASVRDGLGTRDLGPVTRLAMGSSSNLRGFTTGNAQHDAYIVESSLRHRIDPLLIYAQMHQESSFKIRATSHKGASGLMQLMPATARRFGVTSIYDPKQNIDAGVKYMRWLLDFFGQDVVLALAGYNAGEGAVLKYGRNIPPYRETQEYVRRITSRYRTISDPRYVTSARATNVAANKVDQKDPTPLSIYEPEPLTLRTADGKMMLVSQ